MFLFIAPRTIYILLFVAVAVAAAALFNSDHNQDYDWAAV